MLLSLQHVHMKQILHRDLKTQNILLDKKREVIKIGDFGISKVLSSKSKAHSVSPYFETLRKKPWYWIQLTYIFTEYAFAKFGRLDMKSYHKFRYIAYFNLRLKRLINKHIELGN